MSETIFGKIIKGEVPCHRVYEDAHVLAFLDVNPLSPGHLLIIPKEPVATMDQLSDDAAAALGRVLPRLARAVMTTTGTRHYNLLQNNGAPAGQSVFHLHVHIIPKYPDGRGLRLGWQPGPLDPDEARKLAAAMAQTVSD